jgi:hypothetical protein
MRTALEQTSSLLRDGEHATRAIPVALASRGLLDSSFLKATVKATPVDACGHGSTFQHVGFARRIQNKL